MIVFWAVSSELRAVAEQIHSRNWLSDVLLSWRCRRDVTSNIEIILQTNYSTRYRPTGELLDSDDDATHCLSRRQNLINNQINVIDIKWSMILQLNDLFLNSKLSRSWFYCISMDKCEVSRKAALFLQFENEKQRAETGLERCVHVDGEIIHHQFSVVQPTWNNISLKLIHPTTT